MRILITSGTGLIGSSLVDELSGAGHELWVLSRSQRPSRPGVSMVKWDSRSSAGWGHLVEQADAMVNLTGENIGAGPWTARRRREIMSSRILAGYAVREAVRQAAQKPRVLLQASAIGYYGETGERTVTEGDPNGSDFLSQVVAAWEDSTREVEEQGVRRVIARTGLVISKQGGFMTPVILQYNLMGGGTLGGGRQWWSWIHIQDVARAMRFLIENEQASGAYNLTAPDPVRMAEFGRAVGSVMRRPHWFPLPGFALKLVLGEMSRLVLDSQRVLPERLLAAGFEFEHTDVKAALRNALKGA